MNSVPRSIKVARFYKDRGRTEQFSTEYRKKKKKTEKVSEPIKLFAVTGKSARKKRVRTAERCLFGFTSDCMVEYVVRLNYRKR